MFTFNCHLWNAITWWSSNSPASHTLPPAKSSMPSSFSTTTRSPTRSSLPSRDSTVQTSCMFWIEWMRSFWKKKPSSFVSRCSFSPRSSRMSSRKGFANSFTSQSRGHSSTRMANPVKRAVEFRFATFRCTCSIRFCACQYGKSNGLSAVSSMSNSNGSLPRAYDGNVSISVSMIISRRMFREVPRQNSGNFCGVMMRLGCRVQV
mmetsp:Transcript_14421/g.36031  ORF Transcript_14421/g.36031 Transcript_14421/m.36031 type:complete len:205 (+) Transcript_14421:1365-1979(+)